jgi:hypothetical protein
MFSIRRIVAAVYGGAVPVAMLALMALLTGCSAVLYAPGAHHVPVPQETGEVRVGGQVSTLDDYAATASVSPVPHVLAHGMIQRTQAEGEEYAFGEAGLGLYHHAFLERSGRARMTLSAHGAWGRGTTSSLALRSPLFTSRSLRAEGRLERYTLQMDVGLWLDLFETVLGEMFIAGSLRFSDVELYDVTINDEERIASQFGSFVEPSLRLGVDFGTLRLFTTTSIVFPMQTFQEPRLTYRSGYLGLGLSLDLTRGLRR